MTSAWCQMGCLMGLSILGRPMAWLGLGASLLGWGGAKKWEAGPFFKLGASLLGWGGTALKKTSDPTQDQVFITLESKSYAERL